tara:strand:+ start:96347 stop:97420 length:1074 start_codon:yes stop_codon:yes gene_type:complete
MKEQKYKELQLTPAQKIDEWESVINNLLSSGEDIYIMGDTETTGGVEKKSNTVRIYERDDKDFIGRAHRILEIGFELFTKNKENGKLEPIKDKEGNAIFFHEYINFNRDDSEKKKRIKSIDTVPKSVLHVHNISIDFLNGVKPLNQNDPNSVKLNSPAPNFQEIIEPLMKTCGLLHDFNEDSGKVYSIFHNTDFDLKFLDFEFQNLKHPIYNTNLSPFQSFVVPLDTLRYFRDAMPEKEIKALREEINIEGRKNNPNWVDIKGVHAIDTLVKIFEEKKLLDNSDIDRTLHGARKDVIILSRVYNAFLDSEFYQKGLNKRIIENPSNEDIKNDIKKFVKSLKEKRNPLPKIKKNKIRL